MIFTVGKTEMYERWFQAADMVHKSIGGSVWRSQQEAEDYLERTGLSGSFTVYAVEADWETDTTEDPDCTDGETWRALTRIAPIFPL